MSQIKYRIVQQHHQLFMLSNEGSRERMDPGLNYHAFPDPLPELRLCGPKLLAISADNERRPLLIYLLFLN